MIRFFKKLACGKHGHIASTKTERFGVLSYYGNSNRWDDPEHEGFFWITQEWESCDRCGTVLRSAKEIKREPMESRTALLLQALPKMTEIDTLGDALPREIARVTTILGHYEQIGPAGQFGATLIRYDLSHATKALASGDVAEMIVAYKVLKDIVK